MIQDIRLILHKTTWEAQAFATIVLRQDLILFQHTIMQITRTQSPHYSHTAVKIGGWLFVSSRRMIGILFYVDNTLISRHMY
jgi:hypothetical protein